MTAPPIVPDSELRGAFARLPSTLRTLLVLARFDRPTGAWLLFWPGAWAVALAGYIRTDWPLLVWFAVGSVAMRGAGCVYNDIVDRRLDRQVARTRDRPLASGQIGLRAAWAWLVSLCLVGLVVVFQLRYPTAMIVAVASLGLVAAYPYMKRITWWPQAWLGLVFSWGALVGWCATQQGLDSLLRYYGGAGAWEDALPGLLLWLGAVAWVVGYDTIYALQDVEDDALAGIRSSARRLGRRARLGVAAFYGTACLFWAACFWQIRPDPLALAALLPVAAHLGWQVARLRPADPADALRRFRANRFTGFLMFCACGVVGATVRVL
jgi:4-hydroxybenzoate polyprenyltransferase